MAFNSSTLHINTPLTDLALAYRADMDGFAWMNLLPPKIVNKRSDLIRSIDKGNLLREHDLRTGKGGRVQEVQFKVGGNQFFNAIDYAVQTILRNTERMEADEILQYDQENIYHCLIAMNTKIECVTVRDTLRNPAVMTQYVSLTASQYWDNYNSPQSDPIDDIMVGIYQVWMKTGHMPNNIVMHPQVWGRIQRNPRILARGPVANGGLGIVSMPDFEKILGLPSDTIKLTSAIYNNAPEDQPANYVSMIGPDVIISYSEPPSQRNIGLGYSFMFQDASAGGNDSVQAVKEIEAPFLVYEFPDNGLFDPRGATVHRLVGGLDQKVLNPEAGYLIKNVVDPTAPRYAGYLSA